MSLEKTKKSKVKGVLLRYWRFSNGYYVTPIHEKSGLSIAMPKKPQPFREVVKYLEENLSKLNWDVSADEIYKNEKYKDLAFSLKF